MGTTSALEKFISIHTLRVEGDGIPEVDEEE